MSWPFSVQSPSLDRTNALDKCAEQFGAHPHLVVEVVNPSQQVGLAFDSVQFDVVRISNVDRQETCIGVVMKNCIHALVVFAPGPFQGFECYGFDV